MPEKSSSAFLGDIVTRTPELTLADLCERCGLPEELIVTYISEGIIQPEGESPGQWRFSRLTMMEVRRASRLERDLDLNAPGVALVLDLMRQIEELKGRLARFEAPD